jgi:hypothetical protein
MQSTMHRNDRKTAHTHAHAHTHTHTQTPKPGCKHEDVTKCYGIKRYKDKVMANRPDMIIKNRKEETCIESHVAILRDRKVMQI